MIYFDNAATSWPKPQSVYNEVLRCMRVYCANPGRSGHKMSMKASEVIYECRENLSKLFCIENPLNIVFTCNTTDSLNIAIKGTVRMGDHVIISSLEHNSVVRPIKKLSEKGVEYSILDISPNGLVDFEELDNLIKDNTKLIIMTHASNVTGTLLPIEEVGKVAKEKGILFMVDAAQTAGVKKIDVNKMNIDLLALPGHKGLFGPQGTGVLYIREGIEIDTIKEGGTGSNSELLTQPEFLPDRFESGTVNTPGIAGLNEGVKYILRNGIEAIDNREKELTAYFIEHLKSIKPITVYGILDSDNRTSTISISIKDLDCMEVAHELDSRYSILVRSGLHCAYLAHKTLGTIDEGTIRFSFNIFNTYREIDRAIIALKNIV